MTIDPKQPRPGVYRDLDAATYHALDCASASRLNLLNRSPAHLKASLDSPAEQTPALVLGEAAHFSVLQPDLFSSRYQVAPDCDRRTKEGKAVWADFLETCAGKSPLKVADFDTCQRMRDAVWAHPAARKLLEGRTATEPSCVWNCRETNVLCKMRADLVCDNGLSLVGDLKTTNDASRDAFERSIWNYGYHRQAAHYLSGLAANRLPLEHFCIIAVEKEAPYAVAVYRLLDEVVAAGAEDVRRLLAKYRECRESGRWPGYSERVEDVGIPRWALRQIEEAA